MFESIVCAIIMVLLAVFTAFLVAIPVGLLIWFVVETIKYGDHYGRR